MVWQKKEELSWWGKRGNGIVPVCQTAETPDSKSSWYCSENFFPDISSSREYEWEFPKKLKPNNRFYKDCNLSKQILLRALCLFR